MAQIILDSANNVIQGDFDTATLSLRTRMQTSTTNATTGVYAVPNGSATSASFQASNAADPTNASKIVMATNGSTDVQIVSGANGSGTYLPLSFYTNNDIRFQMGTSGELGVRTGVGTVSYGTSGQYLKSNGPGAGVSWATAAAGGFSNMTVYTSGSGTFTTPATTTTIKVTVVGGGGAGGDSLAGGGNGGGGGAGGAAIRYFPVSGSTGYSYTVGSAGSTSSFGPVGGTTISGTGGASGSPNNGAGGSGGSGTNGQLNISGGNGCRGGDAGVTSGPGGGSILGGSGPGTYASTASPGVANTGGGGGGAWRNNPGGQGSGAAGVVIVEY